MTAHSGGRRNPEKVDTARMAAARACFRHLRDLRREHGKPPPDVPLPKVSTPRFVPGILEYSWCGSPAGMCAELGEK